MSFRFSCGSEKMFDTLVKNKITSKKLSYKPTAVIVGQTGAGKTSLGNKLCNTNHNEGACGGSLTQELFRNNVCVGMNPFWFIDTPGTDSSTDTYKHAFLLREAVTVIPINTIFFVIKYENRFERMINIFYSQPVELYSKKVVVMISHLDQSKDPIKDFQNICTLFAEECPDVSNVIFYSEHSVADEIAAVMFSCISNMNCDKINISDEEFQLKFNTFQATFRMRASYEEYKRKSNKMREDAFSYIQCEEFRNESQADKDEILHVMLVKFRNELDAMYSIFVKEHGSSMVDIDVYTCAIKMQAENVKLCEQFTNTIIPLMSYNLFDNEDPRNLIKQCPNCELIWYKTEGCDGATTCGNRDFQNSTTNFSFREMYNYVVTYLDGKFRVKKNPSKTAKSTPTPARREISGVTHVGCNATMVWRDLPKLDDKLILELYHVSTMELVKSMITADRFSETRRKYEKNIDTRFHQ